MPMSSSALLNKSLRRHVSAVLRDAGFQRIDARNGWRWADAVCVFNIRAVGGYFADVTGWPPSSVGVWLGVLYPSISTPTALKQFGGRLLPAEHECQLRSHLECSLPQGALTSALKNPMERERRDLWWVDPDGANAEDVAADIALQLVVQGLPWFARGSNIATALSMVQSHRDCFNKFMLAAQLAEQLGEEKLASDYRALAQSEGGAIGLNPGRVGWFSVCVR